MEVSTFSTYRVCNCDDNCEILAARIYIRGITGASFRFERITKA